MFGLGRTGSNATLGHVKENNAFFSQRHVRQISAYSRQCRVSRVSTRAQEPAERVLRYVDGRERRIIYPSPDYTPLQDLIIADADGGYRSFSETEQPDRWGPPEWDVAAAWSRTGIHPQNVSAESTRHSGGADGLAHQQAQHPPQQQRRQLESQTFQSQPATDHLDELFAQFDSIEYRDAQKALWQRVADSYQVLDSCPWPLPRQLYVLAVQQIASPAAAMFTLQTRVQQQATENELAKVLGHSRRDDGSAVLMMHRMAEGVVTFASEPAAEMFGEALEAAGTDDVSIATVDSHALFRLTGEGSAVVVLIDERGEHSEVNPGELEASLRSRGQATF